MAQAAVSHKVPGIVILAFCAVIILCAFIALALAVGIWVTVIVFGLLSLLIGTGVGGLLAYIRSFIPD